MPDGSKSRIGDCFCIPFVVNNEGARAHFGSALTVAAYAVTTATCGVHQELALDLRVERIARILHLQLRRKLFQDLAMRRFRNANILKAENGSLKPRRAGFGVGLGLFWTVFQPFKMNKKRQPTTCRGAGWQSFRFVASGEFVSHIERRSGGRVDGRSLH